MVPGVRAFGCVLVTLDVQQYRASVAAFDQVHSLRLVEAFGRESMALRADAAGTGARVLLSAQPERAIARELPSAYGGIRDRATERVYVPERSPGPGGYEPLRRWGRLPHSTEHAN